MRFAAALAVSLLVSSEAWADPVGTQTVELTVASQDEDGPKMETLGRELLERLGVQADVRPAPPRVDLEEVLASHSASEAPVLARAWIDLTRSDRALLYLADSTSARILVRQLPRTSSEMTREALGVILETAIDALMHGGQIGITREAALAQLGTPPKPVKPKPEALPKKVPPRKEPPIPVLLEAGVDFAGQALTESAVTLGPMLSLAAMSRAKPHLGAWIQLQARFLRGQLGVTENGTTVLSTYLTSGVGRLLGCFQSGGEPTALRVGLGLGVEIMRYDPVPAPPSSAITALPGATVSRPLASAAVILTFRVAPWISLQLGAFADVPLQPTTFVVTTADRAHTSAGLDLWSLRPGWMLGAALP